MAGPHNTSIAWVRTRMGPGTQETLGDFWEPFPGFQTPSFLTVL